MTNVKSPGRVLLQQRSVLTVFLFEIVSTLRLGIRRTDPLHLESLHNLIQQPVDDLEPRALVTPDCCSVPDVPRLPLQTGILEHDVGRFKHFDRERVRPVLPDRLE